MIEGLFYWQHEQIELVVAWYKQNASESPVEKCPLASVGPLEHVILALSNAEIGLNTSNACMKPDTVGIQQFLRMNA